MLKLDRLTLEPRFIDRNICFCDGGGDSGGGSSEPDGVTFTGAGGGQGISISSDTLSSDSTDDTYAGFNTSPAKQAELLGDGTFNDPFESGSFADPNIGFTSGVTGDAEFTGIPAAGANLGALGAADPFASGAGSSSDFYQDQITRDLAKAASDLTPEQQAIVETARMMGDPAPDFNQPMTVADKAKADSALSKEFDIFTESTLDPAAGQEEARAAQAALDAINQNLGITTSSKATAQNVLDGGSGISTLDSTDDARAQATKGVDITGPTSRPLPDQVYDFDTSTASDDDIVDDIFTPVIDANITQAPYDPSVQDEEQTSAISDNFLDERGREDMNAMSKEISNYFENPIVDFAQTYLGPVGDIFTDAAGMPRFGNTTAMTNAIQQGGRLIYNEDGSPNYVLMEDGTQVGAPVAGAGMAGGGDGGSTAVGASTVVADDPCPQGFQMVDGACQPIDQEKSSFNIGKQDSSGLRFTPFTQATAVDRINPFMLNPYTTEQQAIIDRGRSNFGVRPVSPTARATGRT